MESQSAIPQSTPSWRAGLAGQVVPSEVHMRDGEPGWFYVGSGQLRYKDMDGWTDQFQDLDGPAKGPAVGPDESPDVPGPITEQGIRGRRRHKPLPFITFCAAAARGLIGVPIRLMGAL